MPLQAVLTDFAGEAGRHTGAMEDISRKLSGRADLESRMIAENRIYLEDSSPASRVRAFDWLQMRGQAPANFDPLAKRRIAALHCRRRSSS